MSDPTASNNPASDSLGADAALDRMLSGNRRFVERLAAHEIPAAANWPDLVAGQSPFAVIVGCSDSRVPAEIVFDQGVGDLFVIRTAGHRVDDIAIASVEFAVQLLGSRLIMVLGHQNCGAVTSAIAHADDPDSTETLGAEPTNHIPRLLAKLQNVIKRSRKMPGDPIRNAVEENVRTVVRRLTESSSVLQEAIHEDGLRIVGGYYSLETGRIDLVE